MTMIMVAPIDAPDGALFGHGVNQLTGERIAVSCVQNLPAPVISVPSDSGDHTTTLIVQDSASYSQLMSTVANLSASGVSWSASASVSYLREQANSDTTVTLTWTRIARTQDRMVDWTSATIAPDALALLRNQGVDAFLAKYGTHCIIGIAYGGSFSGYSRIETQSVSDKEQLKASISGSVSGFGVNGSVSASFEQDLQSSNIHFTSSQDSNVVGAAPISFTGLDIAGMQNAVRAFAPSANGPLPGVSGAPVALVCVSWNEFADIATALGSNVGAIGLTTEEHALLALSSEYSALTYVAGTAASLQNSPAVIPAYGPLLARLGDTADRARTTIAQLTLQNVRDFASSGTGSYVLAATLKPQTDRIGNGYGEIQVSYSLDWAFNNASSTFTRLLQPGGGEQNLGGFNHYRAEGNDDGDQVLSLLYTFDRDANGVPFIGARLHFQDPYAPEATQQQDFGNGRQLLNQTAILSYTAAWPDYPWNQITITLVPPTG
ncbi:MAG: MAC/perforin domain-containing protein [Pseudomonadota bacterium]|uniref:MAC/perforin domain-containing protein n=1 Tax=Sphingomonas sp. ERG5 TaxID=1381597 RepID=UPI00054C6C65|nr:MAC/perforin domain-containing protein [Sphingomonas sp. ERG5]